MAKEVEDVIGLPCMDAPRVSAKMGIGIRGRAGAGRHGYSRRPQGDADAPAEGADLRQPCTTRYKGVIVYLRVFEGTVKPGDTVKPDEPPAPSSSWWRWATWAPPALAPCGKLEAGEVGYLTASIKTRGRTPAWAIPSPWRPTPRAEALPGYRKVTPMVFCGIYPADGAKYPDLKDALEKLQLNDASPEL